MPFFDQDGNEIELSAETPEVKDLIEGAVKAAVKEATSGLSQNKDEILGEKKELQAKLDQLNEQWKDLDPEKVRLIMDQIENNEEAKLLSEGKTEEVISRRTERLQADHEKQISNLQEKINGLTSDLESSTSTVKKLKIEGSLRQAASELSVVPSAIEDVLARAMTVFKVAEDGSLIPENSSGTMYGKDGKTPMIPSEWLDSMKETAPHWFPAPSGGGAGGGNERGGGNQPHVLSREDALDPAKYRAAKSAAQEAGVELQIAAA